LVEAANSDYALSANFQGSGDASGHRNPSIGSVHLLIARRRISELLHAGPCVFGTRKIVMLAPPLPKCCH
jgi:hypothetical protein